MTLGTPCPATTDQLTSGERNEDLTFPECTDRSDETVNGSIHESPQSHKQQTECPAEETAEPGGAGQGLEPPLWDPSCPINLEELTGEYKVIVLEEDGSDDAVTDSVQG